MRKMCFYTKETHRRGKSTSVRKDYMKHKKKQYARFYFILISRISQRKIKILESIEIKRKNY
ncbi:hypothetical protein PUN28_019339 [Cardiocondyla obscurior]|uniref:Uncharacterized protein n=1 Tax=Cardiocondyla obscurior TaxID=286306 RepID=A0AAW2EER8_9HYME